MIHHNPKVKNALDFYKDWVSRNYRSLILVDDVVSRLLYFAPANSSEDSHHWQDILWGCLHLYRLMVELATNERFLVNTYGASVALTEDQPDWVTFALRLAITILQSIGPIIQELFIYKKNRTRAIVRMKTAKIKFWIESMRFAFRIVILGRYWRRSRASHPYLVPGILQRGGLLDARPVPTACDELAALERSNYTGRRTGRRVCHFMTRPNATCHDDIIRTRLCVIVGEALYITRPLILAAGESSGRSGVALLPYWLYSFAMDVLSLTFLSDCGVAANKCTVEEYRRRQTRLLLYLLRPPIWSQTTKPSIEKLSYVTTSFPVVGTWLTSLIWEFVYQMKMHWAEEG